MGQVIKFERGLSDIDDVPDSTNKPPAKETVRLVLTVSLPLAAVIMRIMRDWSA